MNTETYYTTEDFTVQYSGMITRVRFRLYPGQVDTIATLNLGNVVVWESPVILAGNSNSELQTFMTKPTLRVNADDELQIILTKVSDPESVSVARAADTYKLPKWKQWKLMDEVPVWFENGVVIKITARASKDTVITGTVEEWNPKTGKFLIKNENLPEKWNYNTWTITLVDPYTAFIQDVRYTQEYEIPVEPEPIPELIPELEPILELIPEPIPEPIKPRRKRRIMM